jgi:hypothetical protein
MIRLRFLLILTFLACVVTAAYGDVRSDAREQVQFGINVAQRGLWKEALYRGKRAAEIDPTYAAAFNNRRLHANTKGNPGARVV